MLKTNDPFEVSNPTSLGFTFMDSPLKQFSDAAALQLVANMQALLGDVDTPSYLRKRAGRGIEVLELVRSAVTRERTKAAIASVDDATMSRSQEGEPVA